jgi:hypothetical protein
MDKSMSGISENLISSLIKNLISIYKIDLSSISSYHELFGKDSLWE